MSDGAVEKIRRPEHIHPVVDNITAVTGDNPQFAYNPEKALYVRTDDHTERMGEWLEQRPNGSITLSRWQQWGQDAWKVRHGTPEASQRFVTKLYEEYHELGLEIYRAVKKDSADNRLRKKIIAESGDILWCIGAAASNIDISIEESYREYLSQCSNGTKIRLDGRYVSPYWRETAMSQVVIGRLLTDHDVDRFLASGYVPQPSPDMNLEPEDFFSPTSEEILHDWAIYEVLPSVLATLSFQYYGVYEDLAPREEPTYIDAAKNAADARRIVAESFIRTLYVAKMLVGATTGEILRENYRKLNGRAAMNLLDKQDGERPDHLC